MIIACPKCFTRYNVPAASLGSVGRMVKCKNCGHKWHQSPPEGTAVGTSQDTSQPPRSDTNTHTKPDSFEGKAPIAPLPQEQNQTRESGNVPALRGPGGQKILPLWVGMAMGAVLTLVVLGVGVLIKEPLFKALPAMASIISSEDPTKKLEASTADTQGLVVENIQRDIIEEGGFTTYVIAGEVVNTNMNQTSVPNLKVSLLDERGNLIDQWRVQPQQHTLSPTERTTWVCYFYNPPLAKVSEYKVEFVN